MRHLLRTRKYPIWGYFLGLPFYFLLTFTALAQGTALQLRLEAEKQVLVSNERGQQVSWQSLSGKTAVQPGDAIRYTVQAIAPGDDRPIENFAIAQPIPKQTAYILNSATGNNAKITYSIDNGKTFVDNPTIEVRLPDGKVERQPAPASNYTHIRWKFEGAIAPSAVKASYQVRVQ